MGGGLTPLQRSSWCILQPSQLAWDEVKIIDIEEHGRIRCFKESAHMLGYSDKYRDEYNMGTSNQKG